MVVVTASPAAAAVWRCHTPTGDVWTNQPEGFGDCEEFAGTHYPSAEPPAYPSPPVPSAPEQVMPPPPPPPVYESASLPLYPPGSGTAPGSGPAGTSEGIALAESVALAEDMAEVGRIVAEDIAEGIGSSVGRCSTPLPCGLRRTESERYTSAGYRVMG
jgi:hypothetical protein